MLNINPFLADARCFFDPSIRIKGICRISSGKKSIKYTQHELCMKSEKYLKKLKMFSSTPPTLLSNISYYSIWREKCIDRINADIPCKNSNVSHHKSETEKAQCQRINYCKHVLVVSMQLNAIRHCSLTTTCYFKSRLYRDRRRCSSSSDVLSGLM